MTETVRRKIILTVYGYKNLHICQAKFVENEPSEICSHLSEMGPKGRFLCADIFENHTSRGRGKGKKERGRRKEEKRKKSNGCAISFYIGGYFGEKKTLKRKLLHGRGLVGDNVHKSRRYIYSHILAFFDPV